MNSVIDFFPMVPSLVAVVICLAASWAVLRWIKWSIKHKMLDAGGPCVLQSAPPQKKGRSFVGCHFLLVGLAYLGIVFFDSSLVQFDNIQNRYAIGELWKKVSSAPADQIPPKAPFVGIIPGNSEQSSNPAKEEILQRLLSSLSFVPEGGDVWTYTWIRVFFSAPLFPHENRSVFSVRNRLENGVLLAKTKPIPDNPTPSPNPVAQVQPSKSEPLDWSKHKWLVLSILFAGEKEVSKANAALQSPLDTKNSLAPTHFDGIRERLLKNTSGWTGYVRAAYAGWPNILIIAFATYIFTTQYIRHWSFVTENRYQTEESRSNNEEQEMIETSRLDIQDWLCMRKVKQKEAGRCVLFWKCKNVSIFEQRIHSVICNGKTNPILKQLEATLADLRTSIPYWVGVNPYGVRESITKLISHHATETLNEWLQRTPTGSPAAKRHIELLTELGFVGTIIGIIAGMAEAATTQVPSNDPLFRSAATGQMLSSLSIAFSTTLIGLLCAMLLGWRYRKWEDEETKNLIDAVTSVRLHLESKCIDSFILDYSPALQQVENN